MKTERERFERFRRSNPNRARPATIFERENSLAPQSPYHSWMEPFVRLSLGKLSGQFAALRPRVRVIGVADQKAQVDSMEEILECVCTSCCNISTCARLTYTWCIVLFPPEWKIGLVRIGDGAIEPPNRARAKLHAWLGRRPLIGSVASWLSWRIS